jgi:hypothetical protein
LALLSRWCLSAIFATARPTGSIRFSLKKLSSPFALTLSFYRLNRVLALCSVRRRIIVLGLIPVAGFLAIGLTDISGEKS